MRPGPRIVSLFATPVIVPDGFGADSENAALLKSPLIAPSTPETSTMPELMNSVATLPMKGSVATRSLLVRLVRPPLKAKEAVNRRRKRREVRSVPTNVRPPLKVLVACLVVNPVNERTPARG